MAALHSLTVTDFIDSLISLLGAFVLGALIGAERQYRQRQGGLRTNTLVALGAAAFVDIGMHLNGNAGATQIIAYVVSGVGFIGAGVIMKQGGNVWGLNTAATLWCSAAVGACAGADLAIEAILLTGLVLAGNTLLRPLVNAINRAPMNEQTTEAIYEVRLATHPDNLNQARELLTARLQGANYPIREIEVLERDEETIEVVATLLGTSGNREELDAVVAALDEAEITQHASWAARTLE
jgi:putative Mg2+ transporter-C (MgtC) family protein